MKTAVITNHTNPSMNGKTVYLWRKSGMRLQWVSFTPDGKHYLMDKKYLVTISD